MLRALRKSPPSVSAAEIEEKVTIEESGDTAKAILPDQNEPLEWVKVDGVWKAKLPEKDLPPAEQRPQAVAMMQTLASVMNEASEKVGKEDASLRTAKNTLGGPFWGRHSIFCVDESPCFFVPSTFEGRIKEGYTAEKIEKEMAAAVQKAMQEMTQKRSRSFWRIVRRTASGRCSSRRCPPVVATFDDGSPAITRKGHGQGACDLFATRPP